MLATQKKKTKKRTRKGPQPIRRERLVLRVPVGVIPALDSMAGQVGMSRNMLAALVLSQAAAMHRASEQDPGLFSPLEQSIDAAFAQAVKNVEKGARRD